MIIMVCTTSVWKLDAERIGSFVVHVRKTGHGYQHAKQFMHIRTFIKEREMGGGNMPVKKRNSKPATPIGERASMLEVNDDAQSHFDEKKIYAV